MRGHIFAATAVALWALSAEAFAADVATLKQLVAPPPAPIRIVEPSLKPEAVKFARLAVQLGAEPWARVVVLLPGGTSTEDYVTWKDGQVDLSAAPAIFSEEMRAAGVPIDDPANNLFANDTASNLQVGVRITDMKARLCQSCGWSVPYKNWVGEVTMDAQWQVYSSLERRVVATVETRGGFTAPKKGLAGEPDRLVMEAFRDNVRRLTASEQFRNAITAVAGPPADTASGTQAVAPMRLLSGSARPIPDAARSVVGIFAGDGFGSGFLVSRDGLVLTNQHVVGGVKFVKLRWSDGSETLGEVVRSDRKRDVALLKTEPKGRMALALRGGVPLPGEAVYAIGMPLDEKYQNTVTKGVVSGSRVFEGLPYLQSDVAIDHGNSGGPLLDEQGRVVALTVARDERDGVGHNINFFIPIDDALRALALQIETPPPAAPPKVTSRTPPSG